MRGRGGHAGHDDINHCKSVIRVRQSHCDVLHGQGPTILYNVNHCGFSASPLPGLSTPSSPSMPVSTLRPLSSMARARPAISPGVSPCIRWGRLHNGDKWAQAGMLEGGGGATC